MRDLMEEEYFGVLNAGLLQSALDRPKNAAEFEDAAPIRQAAYLFQGLLMNHGFVQGNKRTAYLALEWFLNANGIGEISATHEAVVEFCIKCQNKKWSIDQIEAWLRANIS